jgi:hypothetical protein
MMTTTERKKLTEPLASVTEFFGWLMVLALAVIAGLRAFGPRGYGGLPSVCENQPGTTFNGSWTTPFVAAKPGASIDIIGTVQACAVHPGIAQWALYGQTIGGDLFVELAWGVVRSTMPVPALAGAALLSLARIFRVGVAMENDLKGTV